MIKSYCNSLERTETTKTSKYVTFNNNDSGGEAGLFVGVASPLPPL